MPALVLASSSPRRHELLGHLGLPFSIDPSGTDESAAPGLSPRGLSIYLAERKARAVARRHPRAVVIGADTLVECQGQILNKPIDAEDARRMLRQLAGVGHQVHTGLAVCRDGNCLTRAVSATVRMRPLDEAAIAAYVASGEPLDKAGAYAAQGLGAALIAGVEGSFLAVVGLPLLALRDLLIQSGLIIPAAPEALAALERGEQPPGGGG